MKPLCTIFREQCLANRCTAFILKDKVGEPYYSKEWDDVIGDIVKDQPYCNMLNIFLPKDIMEK